VISIAGFEGKLDKYMREEGMDGGFRLMENEARGRFQ